MRLRRSFGRQLSITRRNSSVRRHAAEQAVKLPLLSFRQFLRSPGVHQEEQNLVLVKPGPRDGTVHDSPRVGVPP